MAAEDGAGPLQTSDTASGTATSKRGVLFAAIALLVVLALAAVAYNVFAGGGAPQTASHSASGQSSEYPQLVNYDSEVFLETGQAMRLTQIAEGKPLVVNFWATWCPYCIEELPDFQQVYHEYSDRVSFAFIDATDGTRETLDIAKAYIEQNGFDMPFYYDTAGNAMMEYGISGLPTTVLVDADGNIVSLIPGAIDASTLRQVLDTLLEG